MEVHEKYFEIEGVSSRKGLKTTVVEHIKCFACLSNGFSVDGSTSETHLLYMFRNCAVIFRFSMSSNLTKLESLKRCCTCTVSKIFVYIFVHI